MSENCNHDCSSCGEACASRDPKSFIEKPNEKSTIKKVIGVISGKGGVGKSMISSMLAANFQKKGYNTAVLDADITGPSIPKAFGITERARGDESGIYPVYSKTGIQTMSVNLLLDDATDPVIWRGPVIAGTVIVIVTSPQELVSMIVAKAVKMAQMMNVPIIGIIENMSYVECPDCGKHIEVFGKSHLAEVAAVYKLPILGQIPMTPAIAAASDAGDVESLDVDWFDKAIEAIVDATKE